MTRHGEMNFHTSKDLTPNPPLLKVEGEQSYFILHIVIQLNPKTEIQNPYFNSISFLASLNEPEVS